MVDVADDDLLYRPVFRYYIKPDGTVSSAAFTNSSRRPDPEVSVDLARLTSIDESLARALPGQGLAALMARVPRELGLTVIHDPREVNATHCLIRGLTSKQECRQLAMACIVIVQPTHQI